MLNTIMINYLSEIQSWLKFHKSTTLPAWLKRNPQIKSWVEEKTQNDSPTNIMESVFILINGLPTLCDCGNRPKFNTFDLGYRVGCYLGNQCKSVSKNRLDNQKKTLIEKYGVDSTGKIIGVAEKRKSTMLKKYGVAYAMQSPTLTEKRKQADQSKTDDDWQRIDKKRKQTSMEKYGVEHHMQSIVQQNKVKTTNLKKYGTEFPLQNTYVKQKMFETWDKKTDLERKNHNLKIKRAITDLDEKTISDTIDILFDRDQLKQIINDSTTRKQVAQDLNISVSTLYLYINHHNLSQELNKIKSSFETEIGEFVENLGINTERNVRSIIPPKEIDIFCPAEKIAIECCGLYWHSEKSKNKTKEYHYSKYQRCRDKGIELITIFEDEWNYKKEIVKSRLVHRFKKSCKSIPARKCYVKEIKSSEAQKFVEKYHLQGYIKSKINLGLFDKDSLVAVMTLGSPRFTKKYQYELLRFCSSVNVIGGASKLLSYFVKKYKSSSIVSYSDNRWGSGLVYEKMGFVKETELVGYYYTDYFKRFNRNHFQKYKLVQQGHDANMSEWEIAQSLGYDRIWDCGQARWIYINKHNGDYE